MTERIYSCFAAKIHFPIDISCCESCHEDDEDFNMPLCSFEFNEDEYQVCCKVKEAFLKLNLNHD